MTVTVGNDYKKTTIQFSVCRPRVGFFVPMIRPAKKDDIALALGFGELMHRNSTHASLEYSPEETAQFMTKLIDSDDSYFALEFVDGFLIGGIAGSIQKVYFGPSKIANDHFIFVHPLFRKMKCAERLINSFSEWAKGRGAARCYIGNMAGASVNRKSLKDFEYFGETLMREF